MPVVVIAPHGPGGFRQLKWIYEDGSERPTQARDNGPKPHDEAFGGEDDSVDDDDDDQLPPSSIAFPTICAEAREEASFFNALFKKVVSPGDIFLTKVEYNKQFEFLQRALAVDIKVQAPDDRRTPFCISIHSAMSKRIVDPNAFWSDHHINRFEKGALEECQAMLRAKPTVDKAFAITAVATKIRCWFFRRGSSRLQGYWSNGDCGKFGHYLDFGSEEAREVLELAFTKMKSGLAVDDVTTMAQGVGTTHIAN